MDGIIDVKLTAKELSVVLEGLMHLQAYKSYRLIARLEKIQADMVGGSKSGEASAGK